MTLRLGYGLNDRRFEARFQTGAWDCVWIGCGAHPAYCPKGPGVISLTAERPDLEADHSPSFSTDVNEVCIYTSNDLCVFLEWCNAVIAGTNLPLPLPLTFWRQHFATRVAYLNWPTGLPALVTEPLRRITRFAVNVAMLNRQNTAQWSDAAIIGNYLGITTALFPVSAHHITGP